MPKRKKGRKVAPLRPGQRHQYAPGQLVNSLHPVVRENVEGLATVGYEQDGRGLLIVQISDDEPSGIASAQYLSVAQFAEMNRAVPFAQTQDINKAIARYDPARQEGAQCVWGLHMVDETAR